MRAWVAVLAVALLLVPGTATAEDLDEMLSDGGDFTATGMVMTTWGDDSAAATYEIVRTDGMSMIHGPEGDLMLSGALTASWSDEGVLAMEVGAWSDWELSERYEVSEHAVERLGRPATEVVVSEGDLLRARLVVDEGTSVPVLTEIFAADGSAFRVAALVEFAPSAPDMDMPSDVADHEMLMPAEPSPWLPGAAAGYRLVDTYHMKDVDQAYYSDGLFSFSVFEARRGPTPEEFEGATPFVVDGELYHRVLTPTVVWVHWDAPDHSYVLVGDLPPDHLEAVLQELPEPGRRNLIVRLWRRLFG